MPFPRPTLTALRASAMQDITASDLPNADGFLRRSVLRVMAWVQAGLAYLHYGYLDWISLQSTPFTSTAEYLEAWAALAPTPVLREGPQKASGPGTWSGVATSDLPAGTLLTRPDLTQYITLADATVGGGGSVTVTVQAVLAGSAGNTDSGTPLTLSVVVPGVSPVGSASGPLTGGTDLELDPPLRSRMLESYAAPPHGGNQADYVTWALEVPGVTRAWASVGTVGGTVFVYVMLDASEAIHGGFPQGSNGVATLETRDTAATGDQLTVANYIYPLRPVTPIVYVLAPVPETVNVTIDVWSSLSTTQQGQVATALTEMFLQADSPLGTTSLEQSQFSAALNAIGGLPTFAITVPASWPITSAVGSLFTLGTLA
ncbi:MAG TPA: baseplate J/gp47 family protein [Acetobacteraceae bacterium]|jgi:uncharacterized phage protein gp47/JayE|nr:baseplate J/gp47 family protein [Acetobacteraceae bacterium]